MKIQYILLIIFVLTLGIMGFLKSYKHRYFKHFLGKWKFLLILPVIDIITTILFTSRWGFGLEGNPIGQFILSQFGYLGLIASFFISCIVLFLLFSMEYWFFRSYYKREIKKNKKKGLPNKETELAYLTKWIYYLMGLLTGIYLFVFTINLIAFFYG